MKELMYGLSSGSIVAVLLVCMLLFMGIGQRLGRRHHSSAGDPSKAHVSAVLAAMLGLLALLLGFTFSLALQRYDRRCEAVVVEANTIRTTYLSARLLPIEIRGEVQALLRGYLDLRIRESRVSLVNDAERDALTQRVDAITTGLWTYAGRAVEKDPRDVTSGVFVQSLNGLIGALGAQKAETDRHVPEIAYLVMFAAILLAVATLGYDSGVAGHRPRLPAYALVLLIAVVVFLIMDLDRPRRGAIRVSQDSLLELQRTIEEAGAPAAGSGHPPVAPQTPSR